MSADALIVDEPVYQPSLQELQAPTISYKDRKFLMLLYNGKLKKPEKLRRLILRGYAQVDSKGEIVPTILGSLLIDFSVRAQEKEKHGRKQTPPRKPSRKNRINTFGQRRKRDSEPVSSGELDLGNSDTVAVVNEARVGETG